MDADRGTLRVIGAGFGRTGTMSLKQGLEDLGFAPCYHMAEVIAHPEHVPAWEAAARGERVDFAGLLRGWGAAVDFPAALYYQELMAAFPHAKVVLSTRDPDAWYDSMAATIHPLLTRFPNRHVGPWLPYVSGPFRAMGGTRLRREIMDVFHDRAHVLRVFEARQEEVKRTVPPERLLVWEARQGWKPLCEFLDLPVPEAPFPHVNDTADFKRRVTAITAISWAVLLTPPGLATAAAALWMAASHGLP